MDRAISVVGDIICRRVVKFKERIFLRYAFDFLIELNCGELQQPDGLLQLRRERQVL